MKNLLLKNIKPKFKLTHDFIGNGTQVLDVGLDNDSYSEFKKLFPKVVYHGLDYKYHYVNSEIGDRFFQVDLNNQPISSVIHSKYDVIIVNHVLEHLKSPEFVFEQLISLLKPRGVMYVEYPGIKTLSKPKTKYSYHFHDDESHVSIISLHELCNIAMASGCKIISCGYASTLLKDSLSIPRACLAFLTKKVYGSYLLHFLRKIEYIFVVKL